MNHNGATVSFMVQDTLISHHHFNELSGANLRG